MNEPVAADVPSADEDVADHLADVGARIVQLAANRRGTAAELVDAAHEELAQVSRRLRGGELRAASESLDDLVTPQGGVPTGLVELDKLTGGLQPGWLVVVGGRPALGKTTLAMDFARHCTIRQGRTAAYFSPGMTRRELQMRVLAAEAPVAMHHMTCGTLTDTDRERITRTSPRIVGAPLFIDDAHNLTLADIRTKARDLARQSDLALVVVDDLQLLCTGDAESRWREVADLSRGLKQLARELRVPVVTASQLNRDPEARPDKRPRLSDLRDSGSIEENADVVILIHREDAYDPQSPRVGEADLLIAKHRAGRTAVATVAFQGHYARFVDMPVG